ncbi:50S ribosomal protein L20 [Candidatus Similichlamydia laticola]|uniref:Large ribosomal subunit protein bL20 n=1 Tax=Candidatus Similichlamydia laticola TaxID=2170265 RepID=A0A369KG44_9BACT|nr:50S ribosomal protein L20 [Candidatus Similichlamydia laticola]RDB31675.1 LSU ribosomal protein L20p [Candidatus Similichlamydia laticola]
MVRVTCAVASKKRKKRLRKAAKGFWGDRKNHLRVTKNAVMKAEAYATEHRKLRKRDFRSLWIVRIGIASRMCGLSYSAFMAGLGKMGCDLNRKLLSEMAIHDWAAFVQLAQQAQSALKL